MLRKIYIIDDDEISVFLTEAVLEHLGYTGQIESFLKPAEALAYILENELENKDDHFLIFLDLNMPGISGWDFLDKLTVYEEQLKAHCHVVILSSAVDGREIFKSTQYPLVLNFVPKPLDATSFALVLELLQEKGVQMDSAGN